MKKHISFCMRIVLSLLAFMMTMQMSAESCSLHFSDITINPGGTAKMLVSYETDYENLTGFEFHFALPEGIYMTTSSLSNALMQVCPSLTLEYNNQRDDVTIIMCYTFLEKLPSGKHDLMVLTFQADQNVAKQVYNIETTNNQFAYLGANSPNHMENQIFHITVGNQLIPIKRGDVNGDGGTTLQDILILVDYILADKPSVIDAQNYDIDGDGDVSLSDILIVVDIILNGGAEEQAYLTCPDDHHPHMIDLGLPSGTLWSCCNVGADNPEDYGGYYAWGETEEKSNYSWKTYQYCEGTQETCQYLGNISGTVYDVAHVKWGDGWRIPNYDEIDELCTKCSVETITIHNLVYDKYTGPNGNVIIFPYAGFMWYGSNTDIGKELSYWTSDQYPNTPYQAPYLHQTGLTGNRWLFEGLPVRPIYDPSYFTLSDETVDMFVNSTTTVCIESGSGEYELQNDNPDIIDADLILADKNENPDAKDEICIYGVTEGTATLTVLDKQNNKTATVVVNVKTPTEDDIAETEDYIARIVNFINQQGEISVTSFQNNLTSWLDEQDWVKKVDKSVENVAITLKNGVMFFVKLFDHGLFEDDKNFYKYKEFPTYTKVDVSFIEGEKIIESPNVLYIQGRTMPSFDNQNTSMNNRENDLIQTAKRMSPVNFEITSKFKTLSFLEMNLSKYGMILLGQTHGYMYLHNMGNSGAFQVEDNIGNQVEDNIGIFKNCVALAIKNGYVISTKNPVLYAVSPIEMGFLNINDNTIFYGSYCYSYYLSRYVPFTTFFGYKTTEWYQKGSYQMAEFLYNMSLGFTYEKAIEPMLEEYDKLLYHPEQDESQARMAHIIPYANKPKSKQRYFSISTDEVEFSSEGYPIFKGKINGFEKLKKYSRYDDINYYAYVFDKDEDLESDNIYNDVYAQGRKLKINEDGTFSYVCWNLPFSFDSKNYKVAICIRYKNIIYHGEVKTFSTPQYCINVNEAYYDVYNRRFVVNGQINNYQYTPAQGRYMAYICNENEDFDFPDGDLVNTAVVNEDGTFTCYYPYISLLSQDMKIVIRGFYPDGAHYSEPQSITVIGLCPDEKHPHMIDLGLDAKWSCCDVGANKPTDIGNPYAWGSLSSSYTLGYSFGENIYGTIHDVAYVLWGSPWQMPSGEDFIDLKNHCNIQWFPTHGEIYNGVNPGWIVTGSNGNVIFIPYPEPCPFYYGVLHGIYWSGTNNDPKYARPQVFSFEIGDIVSSVHSNSPYGPEPVRPVAK